MIKTDKKPLSCANSSTEGEENKTPKPKKSSFRPDGLSISDIKRGSSSNKLISATRKSTFSSGLKIGGK